MNCYAKETWEDMEITHLKSGWITKNRFQSENFELSVQTGIFYDGLQRSGGQEIITWLWHHSDLSRESVFWKKCGNYCVYDTRSLFRHTTIMYASITYSYSTISSQIENNNMILILLWRKLEAKCVAYKGIHAYVLVEWCVLWSHKGNPWLVIIK